MYASGAERCLALFVAPHVVSAKGRILILIVWTVLLVIAVIGLFKVETNFSMEFFIPRDSYTERY